MQRYTFPPSAFATGANILIDVGREVAGSNIDDAGQTTPGTAPHADAHVVGANAIAGSVLSDDHYPVHFYAVFDHPFAGTGAWNATNGAPVAGATGFESTKGGGIYASFDTSVSPVVTASIGVSFVSEDNAKLNLETELAGATSFDTLAERTRQAWARALRVIDVQSFDENQLRSFYTALYRVMHHPNVFQDVNGEYLGYDGAVHRIGAPGDPMPAGTNYYANYSFWDTYRAEMPLLMLIAPERVRDMMYSLNAIVAQGGRIPRWGWMNRYADFMNGEPGIAVVADAFCRGLVPPEIVDPLYENMRALALDRDRHRDPVYLDIGYIPYPGNGASGTLEHAINDFALAIVANKLHKDADRDALLALADNWRNVFDPSTRFMRPRTAVQDDEGAHPGPFANNYQGGYSPELPDGWKEGTGWQYTWLVPQNVRGLLEAVGGPDGLAGAQQRMDEFFTAGAAPYAGPEAQQKLSLYGIAFYGNQYSPANEHDLQATWLYNWAGQPWKTQQLQRAMQTLYRNAPDGLPGNDDLGTMSAWFVWSALGLYPVTPGSPTFNVGSPMFNRATIHRKDGDIEIGASGASATTKYVQTMIVGEDVVTRPWIRMADLVPAKPADKVRVNVVLGPVPNLEWGAQPTDAPPSMGSSPMSAFACGSG